MSKRYKRAICWVRRDLRLSDHAALACATELAERVIVAFVFDTVILDELKDRGDRRVSFIHRSLSEVDAKLRALGSCLVTRHGNPTEEIPHLARELEADLVVCARDYEPYALKRDGKVGEILAAAGCEFRQVKDSVVMEPWELETAEGRPFRVYSPFRRAWEKAFAPERDAIEFDADLKALWPESKLPDSVRKPIHTLESMGFEASELWIEPGEEAGRERLSAFASKLAGYADNRNFPSVPATSALSVHLRFGTVSVREMVRLALAHPSPGSTSWLSEIVWREFYQQILYRFPEVVTEPFQSCYRSLEYPGTEGHFRAWCEGQTGYPIVDAAMRRLNATGWMHNRLRMVVASFLTKDLLVDYRWGEAYFAEKLLDFDLASNNGGWQWAASVGADPQPYFRIFNPITQSVKFDAEGHFIREWLPELAALPTPYIFNPSEMSEFDRLAAGIELGKDYPWPIVDHSVQRDKAISLLSDARQRAEALA